MNKTKTFQEIQAKIHQSNYNKQNKLKIKRTRKNLQLIKKLIIDGYLNFFKKNKTDVIIYKKAQKKVIIKHENQSYKKKRIQRLDLKKLTYLFTNGGIKNNQEIKKKVLNDGIRTISIK